MKPEGEELTPIRKRLADLNTKAYYLLVALSFLYIKQSGSAAFSLKAALTLTAVVAVAPVQDWAKTQRVLEWIQRGKFIFLWVGLVLHALVGVEGFLIRQRSGQLRYAQRAVYYGIDKM